MKSLFNFFQLNKSVGVFSILLFFFFFYNTFNNYGSNDIIRSDGDGYYSYLPAIFIYNDASYASCVKAQRKEIVSDYKPLYIHKTKSGKNYNKFFPGVAVLQSPVFAFAYFTSWLKGGDSNGYSKGFQIFFYLGSIFYAFLGLIFFFKSLRLFFPKNKKEVNLVTIATYIATPLFLYISEMPSFSHLYSFTLFGFFTYSLLKIKQKQTTRRIFIFAIIIGLIFIVRPTNLLIILTIPFLLGDLNNFKSFLNRLFQSKGLQFFVGVLGFSIVASIIFILWKWQTGNWIAWSYTGEGFNFLNSKIIDNLFSFRVGLFVHTPLLILSIFGCIIWFKKNSFAATSWLIYFFINLWVIASWWCWDYETPFGNRPFTEHLFFFAFPLVHFAIKYYKTTVLFSVLFSVLSLIRTQQFNSGNHVNQRFTSANYFKSMMFWNEKNKDRWQFTLSPIPFGKMIKQDVLLDQKEIINIDSDTEFALTCRQKFIENRTNERLYIRIELDKKITTTPLRNIFLVMDSKQLEGSEYEYQAIELFNDRYEGLNEWSHLIIERQVYDYMQELDMIALYIWNKDGSEIQLKNVKFTLETYKAD
ncbi:MAG TPA: hypothetical protein EYG86_02885 [Crocinitomicaceae bacterium]|nr:hypothetical protein [Crocinitomicaceae bacterium]